MRPQSGSGRTISGEHSGRRNRSPASRVSSTSAGSGQLTPAASALAT